MGDLDKALGGVWRVIWLLPWLSMLRRRRLQWCWPETAWFRCRHLPSTLGAPEALLSDHPDDCEASQKQLRLNAIDDAV